MIILKQIQLIPAFFAIKSQRLPILNGVPISFQSSLLWQSGQWYGQFDKFISKEISPGISENPTKVLTYLSIF